MLDKLNLSWHTFANHTNEMYSELYNTKKYSDVTLVSDDKSLFRGHKFILSACSSVFRTILDMNQNQTCIYLRGISKFELEPILQFMYLGEATIHQERMGEFLNVAKDLDLKEISSNDDDDDAKENSNIKIKTKTPMQNNKKMLHDVQDLKFNEIDKTVGENDDINVTNYASNLYDEEFEGIVRNDSEEEPLDSRDMVNQLFYYKCNDCKFKSAHKGALTCHIRTKHEGLRFNCNQCGYQATKKQHLIRHIESKHEEIKHPCQFCGYEANSKDSLRNHNKAKHFTCIQKV